MRKSVAGILGLGVLAAAATAGWRAYNARLKAQAATRDWDNAPFPFPPVPRPAGEAGSPGAAPHHVHVPPEISPGGGPETERSGEVALESVRPWMEPIEGGVCPASHPIKAKLASGIYHAPGGVNYDRTNADRCYIDTTSAERDGLRPAKL